MSVDVWERYWAAGGFGPASGCLPGAAPDIDAAQKTVWTDFVKPLRRGARVLDLATGDGVVLARMRASRPDLKLIGVDSSPALPRAPKGIALRPGVVMESLPFADASFDAISSQFGFEYGDTGRIAVEVARVSRPAGRLAIIVHDADGPIVAHNSARRDALGWALDTWLDRARSLVAARRVAAIETPSLFREAPAEARRLFPDQSAAHEVTSAILQTLDLGRRAPPAQSLEVLGTLEARARNEIGRIDQLCLAARDSVGIERMAGDLRDAGFEIEQPDRLRERPGARPFAWLLRARGRG